MNKRKSRVLIESDDKIEEGGTLNVSKLLGLSKRTSNQMDATVLKGNSRGKSSESNSETSDSDSDYDTPKYKKRKLSVTKRRCKVVNIGKINHKISSPELEEASSSDQNSENSEESDSGLGSYDELYENLLDCENKLEQMTQKGREEKLFDRVKKRQDLKATFEKKLFLAKEPKGNKTYSIVLENRQKILEKNKQRKYDKFAALKAKRGDKPLKAEEREEIKEKINLNSEEESKIKRKLKTSEVFSAEENDNEDSTKSGNFFKNKRFSSSLASSTSSSFDSERESGRYQESFLNKEKEKLISSKEELEKIRFSRFKMEKYVHLPIFSKAVIGCFVRIGIGNNQGRPVYRVAEIIEVVETAKIYNLGNTRTNKGLKLRHGNQERVFRLEFMSNTCFSDSEFQKWVESCSCVNVPLPSIDHVKKKQKDIHALLYYQYNADDIEKIIQEKARFNSKPTNFAVAKILLQKESYIASQKGDDKAVERINNQISELEDKAISLDKKRTSTIASISYINERNRKNNVENAEKAILNEIKDRKVINTGDPFTRRPTRPTLMKKAPIKYNSVASYDLLRQLDEERKQKIETERKLKEEDLYRKEMDDKTKRDKERRYLSLDPFAAHNFDVKIDLDVQTPAMSLAPLKLKSIPTSTTNGFTFTATPNHYLKLEEYNKKRGLI